MDKKDLKDMLFKINDLFEEDNERLVIETQYQILAREMRAMSLRERTIGDYERHLKQLCKVNNVMYMDELNRDCIMKYLAHNDVTSQTKLVRLKAIRSIFNRFLKHGWIEFNFWSDINIKVDRQVKEGATKKDIEILLTGLDFEDPTEFRDACVFLTIWETGIRLNTLSMLTVDMVDFDEKLLTMSGDIMKNHRPLSLPISQTLCYMLEKLVQENEDIIKSTKVETDLLFITKRGKPIHNSFWKHFSLNISSRSRTLTFKS